MKKRVILCSPILGDSGNTTALARRALTIRTATGERPDYLGIGANTLVEGPRPKVSVTAQLCSNAQCTCQRQGSSTRFRDGRSCRRLAHIIGSYKCLGVGMRIFFKCPDNYNKLQEVRLGKARLAANWRIAGPPARQMLKRWQSAVAGSVPPTA